MLHWQGSVDFPRVRCLAQILLRIAGWRLVGQPPPIRQCVVIFAPHTSGWDFPLLLLVRLACEHPVFYFGKSELFRGPFGWLFRLVGGIPVERDEHHQLVSNSVQQFKDRKHFWLAMSPEGTRAKADHWRSGFYYIALAAKVPVLLAFVDASRRECGFGKLLQLSGDVERDLQQIRTFYNDKRGIRPELTSDICFKP